MGKTFLVKVPLLAAALDARSESWVFELKGTGDLAFSEQYATKYASGFDDESIKAAFDALGDARQGMPAPRQGNQRSAARPVP